MRKRLLWTALIIAAMSISVPASAKEDAAATETTAEAKTEETVAETSETKEAEKDAAEDGEKVERNENPEEGTGWLAAKLGEEEVDLEYTGMTSGITGTTYNFDSEDYTIAIIFDKSLEVGKETETNAITQIEVMSREASSSGYYFAKKSTDSGVTSKVKLTEKTEEGLVKGEFSVTVPTADRYVGDTKPGMLPELVFTDGQFCFHE